MSEIDRIQKLVFLKLKAIEPYPRWYRDQDVEARQVWVNILRKYTDYEIESAMRMILNSWNKRYWPSYQDIRSLCQSVRNEKQKPMVVETQIENTPDAYSEAREIARPVSDKLSMLPEEKQLEILSEAFLEVVEVMGPNNSKEKLTPGGLSHIRGLFSMIHDGVNMACTVLAKRGAEYLYAVEKRL